ncbi:hypothetical protein PTTG_30061 [Puccinia triticina 1-1 BBBD Race 1]|uniref:Secreted protein n=2 Tax=Puccinia triticina TaxID=208348 RepID=A0A180G0K4_PUCT1|nr:uncharacterized protein PtA15_6A860 [Puccinia triticina]OAV86134.1 hypothetical protein PTTG_30061 [Puccinia triticina 1-1 BBBD Race 1]WAQ86228.1 hypothetical protein PtA15_6A860 [Puccinia triticina]WAR56113.1 hypothetical protein PtB15_6B858 [Puccinia triticina]
MQLPLIIYAFIVFLRVGASPTPANALSPRGSTRDDGGLPGDNQTQPPINGHDPGDGSGPGSRREPRESHTQFGSRHHKKPPYCEPPCP